MKMMGIQQPVSAFRSGMLPAGGALYAGSKEMASAELSLPRPSSANTPQFGRKVGFWGKAWLLTPLLGLGSWLGTSHLETRPVAHARVAMDKHSQELVALDQLRLKEENPIARLNYELLLQKEILKYVSVISDNVSRSSGKAGGNPVDVTILGQIGLNIDEIRFTRSVLEDVSRYEGAENAEKLFNNWADRILAKRVDAPTLERRKAEAKSFFTSMTLNQKAGEALWITMLASFSAFGLITVGGTLKGLFGGSDETKPPK